MKCTEIMRIHLNDKSLCSLAQIYRKIKTFSSNQPPKHISSIVLWKRRQFTLLTHFRLQNERSIAAFSSLLYYA